MPAWIDTMHAVACTAPEVAVLVDTQPITVARFDLVKDLAARKPGAVRRQLAHPDVLARILPCLVARLRDIEPPLVRREGETVGPVEVVGHQRDLAAVRGIPVESGRLFR